MAFFRRTLSGALGRARPLARGCAGHAAPPAPDFQNHRALGQQQELFMINPTTPGSVFFLPHGTRVVNTLIRFMRRQQAAFGFEEVMSPQIYKQQLWEQSGHWEKYKEDMFAVAGRSVRPEEADVAYGLKPMNCPGHCLMFAATDRSYRSLPVRLADYSPLHRNEAAGALSGLTRVRRFHQDDGHIFCRLDQVQAEIASCLRLVDVVYRTFGLGEYRMLLSTRPDVSIGDDSAWEAAESALRTALDAADRPWSLNEGDGAFYGPKIDVLLKDSAGKEHQAATIQLDFQLPDRFDLEYRGDDGAGHRPVMIHRAVYGSVERFLAVLLEHNQGRWPFWLNPRHAVVLPVADRHAEQARAVAREVAGLPAPDAVAPLDRPTFFVDVDDRAESLGARIRAARQKGYAFILVVGDAEAAAGTVAVRERGGGPSSTMDPTAVYDLFRSRAEAYL
ncbi:uncharacterized protein V1510DRAFT_418276 [Dipodascopsis tothii]|uniref:uncharacterized protein n=1 Tax=Dipodascopsis tothii TaxID=44089 RepID=UPI0034CE6BB5